MIRSPSGPEITEPILTALASLGFRDPVLEPLDTGWGPRPGLYVVVEGPRRAVLKRIEIVGWGPRTIVHRLARRRAMRREIAVYRALARRRWQRFRHPELLRTDGRSFLIVSYIEAAGRWPPDVVTRVVDALLEFQMGLAGAGQADVTAPLRPRAPWWLLARATVRRCAARSSPLAIASVAARMYLSVRRSRPPLVAQHGDATFGNAFVDEDGTVTLVDFERTRFRGRTVFDDAVQLAADRREAEGFVPSTLGQYVRSWCTRSGREPAEALDQLRLALLLHTLYVLHGYVSDEAGLAPYRRFLGTIVSDEGFRAWAARHRIDGRTVDDGKTGDAYGGGRVGPKG